MAGFAVSAAALDDPLTAAWVRAQGITVYAGGEGDLERVQRVGVRPVHVVFRCGGVTDAVRRAAGIGVRRFIASTPHHVDALSRCAPRRTYVYLDEPAPAVFGENRLRIIGLHIDVDVSGGLIEWGSAVERLLCRAALMKTCGLPVTRISLAGGSADPSRVATAVEEALDEGCLRWRLPRPVVTLGLG